MDVAERVVTTVLVRGIGGGPERQWYGSVPTQHSGEFSGQYQDSDDDDIFKEYKDMSPTTTSGPSLPAGSTSSSTSISTVKLTAPKKDDRKDF